MLILSRREAESIIINGEIEISIVEISEGRVRVGINAPKSMEVHRKEIFDKIKEESRLAVDGRSRLKSIETMAIKKKK